MEKIKERLRDNYAEYKNNAVEFLATKPIYFVLAGCFLLASIYAWCMLSASTDNAGDYNGVRTDMERTAGELARARNSVETIRGSVTEGQNSSAAIRAGIDRSERTLDDMERELGRGNELCREIAARIDHAKAGNHQAAAELDQITARIARDRCELEKGKRFFASEQSGTGCSRKETTAAGKTPQGGT